jgi:phosphatidylserine decarboxylase
MVAAVGVGHVTASYDPDVATHTARFSEGGVTHRRFAQPVPLARGAELGIFNLGSTTIVVLERGRASLDEFSPGSQLRMGSAIGRIVRRA